MMIVMSAKNPQWGDAGNTFINLLVTFNTIGEVPFTAHPNDSEQHGVEIFNNAAVGNYGPVAPYAAPVVTLAQAQAAQTVTINQACQAQLASIVAPYPADEVATWPAQLADAVAYNANNTAPTPMLSAIAATSGQTVAQLVSSVLTKAAAYQTASGAAIGKRQALTAKISSATTISDIQSVTW